MPPALSRETPPLRVVILAAHAPAILADHV